MNNHINEDEIIKNMEEELDINNPFKKLFHRLYGKLNLLINFTHAYCQ